jgi:hypothetical protein
MDVLSLLPCGLVVIGLATALSVVDVRTARGYALGILSALHLAITVIVVGSITILAQVQPQPTPPHTYSVTVWLVLYFAPSVYVIAVTLIGAAVVAGIAGHWRWIARFLIAAAVPVLVVALPYPYRYVDLQTGYIVQQVRFLGMLVAPEATVLAYSISRLHLPVVPARARQTAPPNYPPMDHP